MSELSEEQKNKMMTKFISCLPMLRARLQLTQEDLAKKLGSTRQTIINIENGKRQLTWSMFLSMVFIFFMNPLTRPFLMAADILDEESCKALFGDTSMLSLAKKMLDGKF